MENYPNVLKVKLKKIQTLWTANGEQTYKLYLAFAGIWDSNCVFDY